MITLAILNYCISIIDYLLTHAFYDVYVYLSNLGTSIQALQVPATIYSIFSLVCYFLPIGTIGVLFFITMTLVIIAGFLGLIYALLNFAKQLPFV